MKDDMGKKQWVYPDLELPPPGDSPLKGHESLIVLNMNDADASIVFCLYFTDKEPIVLAPVIVAARRVRCFRLDNVDDVGIRIPRETQYALRVNADIPVVAQYGRLDTRQQNMAFYTVMGYSG
ncbi:MAG TPA: sensory rhodopsin transducer [Rectinemataceae bacterium]|nr:sensory rhodopsin transducer [Rectinemataceae bacterium]